MYSVVPVVTVAMVMTVQTVWPAVPSAATVAMVAITVTVELAVITVMVVTAAVWCLCAPQEQVRCSTFSSTGTTKLSVALMARVNNSAVPMEKISSSMFRLER